MGGVGREKEGGDGMEEELGVEEDPDIPWGESSARGTLPRIFRYARKVTHRYFPPR